MIRKLSWLLCGALAAAGCDLHVAEQEAIYRYSSADDALELLLIHKGVSAADPREKMAQAKQLARSIVEGRRRIDVQGLSLGWDLDDLAAKLEKGELEKDMPAPERELLARILPGCKLESAAGFIDEKGRLAAYQRFRIARFSQVVELWNRFLSRNLLAAMAETAKFAADTPLVDERTRQLWREHAEAGKPWVQLAGGGFDLEIPLSRASWERVREALSRDLRRDEGPSGSASLGQLVPYLEASAHTGERLRLSFRPAGGRFHTRSWSGQAYDPALREALARDGIMPDEKLSIDQVRALMGPASGGAR